MAQTSFELLSPFIRGREGERGNATCTAYRNFRRCVSSIRNERGRINEGVEEGLRDYRREQSAKKCASTYSLLERTHISLVDKEWCPLYTCFFSDSLTYATFYVHPRSHLLYLVWLDTCKLYV